MSKVKKLLKQRKMIKPIIAKEIEIIYFLLWVFSIVQKFLYSWANYSVKLMIIEYGCSVELTLKHLRLSQFTRAITSHDFIYTFNAKIYILVDQNGCKNTVFLMKQTKCLKRLTSKCPLRRTVGNDMTAITPKTTNNKTPVIPAVPLTHPSPDFVVNKYSHTLIFESVTTKRE